MRALESPAVERAIIRVLESDAAQEAFERTLSSPAVERAAVKVLDSQLVDRVWDQLLASDEVQKLVERIAEAPEVRAAITSQGVGLIQDIGRQIREIADRLDRGHRPGRALPAPGGRSATDATRSACSPVRSGPRSTAPSSTWASSRLGDVRAHDRGRARRRPSTSGWQLALGPRCGSPPARSTWAMFWSLAGQTPGMRFLSIRLDVDGERKDRRPPGHSAGCSGPRSRCSASESASPMIAFDDRRRSLADRIAGTEVIEGRDTAPIAPQLAVARTCGVEDGRPRPRRPSRPPPKRDRGRESGHRRDDRDGAGARTPIEVRALVAGPARRSPGGRGAGFEARAEVLLAARRLAGRERRAGRRHDLRPRPGGPLDETQFAELSYGLSALEFWARQAPAYLADERIESASPFVRGRKLVVRYAPLGVVGVIGPWNYPLNNSFGDCIPALAAGNAVVLKPSEVTPLTSIVLAEMLAESGLPEDVFQVATGRGETGAALVDEVDFVMFTGSVETGKKVMAQAAATLTPVSLELGGKDPMVVLADADLERAANAAVSYGLNNSGQVCISVERIYVEDAVHDEFLERVTDKVEALRQGPPGAPGSVDVGAIIFPPQIELIEAHVPTRSTRAPAWSPAASAARARAASTARRCSPTSTTRCAAWSRRPSARPCR